MDTFYDIFKGSTTCSYITSHIPMIIAIIISCKVGISNFLFYNFPSGGNVVKNLKLTCV